MHLSQKGVKTMKGTYIFEYLNENEFKKLERSVKKYNMLAYKKLIFEFYPKMKEDNYDAFVKHCLNCNIAISPNYNIPSIVPYGSDKGVFTLLKNNPWKNGEK